MYFLLSNLLQTTSARRIWKATKEKLLAEEGIAFLQPQLISRQLQSQLPLTLIHEIIRNIRGSLKNLIETTKVSQTTDSLSYTINKLRPWDNDIIHHTRFTFRKTIKF